MMMNRIEDLSFLWLIVLLFVVVPAVAYGWRWGRHKIEERLEEYVQRRIKEAIEQHDFDNAMSDYWHGV